LVSISCADGTDENSSDSPMAGTTSGGSGGVGGGGGASGVGGGSAAVCGDGQVDTATEQCDPPGQMPGVSCEDMGMPAGLVVCSNACRLMTMCGMGVSGNGGNGAMGGNGG
jgi:hypothetical protein